MRLLTTTFLLLASTAAGVAAQQHIMTGAVQANDPWARPVVAVLEPVLAGDVNAALAVLGEHGDGSGGEALTATVRQLVADLGGRGYRIERLMNGPDGLMALLQHADGGGSRAVMFVQEAAAPHRIRGIRAGMVMSTTSQTPNAPTMVVRDRAAGAGVGSAAPAAPSSPGRGAGLLVHEAEEFEVHAATPDALERGRLAMEQAVREYRRYFGETPPKLAFVVYTDREQGRAAEAAVQVRGLASFAWPAERRASDGDAEFVPTATNTLAHEAMHGLMRARFGTGPLAAWFDEGLAGLVEFPDEQRVRYWKPLAEQADRVMPLQALLARPHPATGIALSGASAASVMSDVQAGRPVTISLSPAQADDSRLFYAQSVAFLTFLVEREGPLFIGRAAAALASGTPVADVLRQARSLSGDPDVLERAWLEWLRQRLAHSGQEEPLPRRAFLGAILAPPPAGSGGVVIQSVFPGHSAERSGLRAGDIVLALEGRDVSSVADMLARLRSQRPGDRLAVSYVRDGERRQLDLVLTEMPRESYADIDVIYDELLVDGARRRTILTKPAGATGPLPTVLLAPGIGCFSMDVPIVEPQGYTLLMNELTRRGYATMRVEKTGTGDSEGPPCAEQDFAHELADHVAAARAIRKYAFVDAERVFLFGVSLGGIHAPLVAAAVADDAPLAGLIVAGTVGTSWFAYEIETRRRQYGLFGTPADEIEERLRTHGLCLAALTVGQRAPAEILAAHPECAGPLEFPAHYTFRRQLVDLDMSGNWRRVRAPVLVVYGTSDYIATAADHYFIAGILNAAQPGQATLRILDGMDHGFLAAADYAASMRVASGEAPAVLDRRIIDELTAWMARVQRAGPERVR